MGYVYGMIGAISNALNGLNQASSRFESAANSLTLAGTSASAEARSSSESTTSSQAREGAGSAGRATALSGDPVQPPPALQDDGIEKAATDLKLAEFSYKASAKVLKSINNTQDQLLDVLR